MNKPKELEYIAKKRQESKAFKNFVRGISNDTTKANYTVDKRLRYRGDPFPEDRPATLEDLVFLPANLSRLVIDPYRDACSINTDIGGKLELTSPLMVSCFDDVPSQVTMALAKGLGATKCPSIGLKPLADDVPWLQLIVDENAELNPDAAGWVHAFSDQFRPIGNERPSPNGVLGMAVKSQDLEQAVPYALEQGFDLLVLDGSKGISGSWPELDGQPDFTVVRDATPSGASGSHPCQHRVLQRSG